MTPGERVYRLHGWSGCEGSRWETLSTATQDGWEHAARLTARLADLTDRLGYGDGITEPQAPNDAIVAGIEAERAEAAEWREHQSWLNDCAAASCDPLEDCPTHAPACHPAHQITGYIDVVMTTLPGPDGEFVETEDDAGRGVGSNRGLGWVDLGDGYHRLRIPASAFTATVTS